VRPSRRRFAAPRFREGTIGRHKPRQHRTDQLGRLDGTLPGFATKGSAIGDEVPVKGGGQLQGQPDRPVVEDRSELQLRHVHVPQPL
jgi:hypothetical protein